MSCFLRLLIGLEVKHVSGASEAQLLPPEEHNCSILELNVSPHLNDKSKLFKDDLLTSVWENMFTFVNARKRVNRVAGTIPCTEIEAGFTTVRQDISNI